MYHSQEGQDAFLNTRVFKGFRNGVFVDVGAHDGVTINNTLFFETVQSWSGILVEPLPSVFQQLEKNRPNAIHKNYAISDIETTVDFLEVSGYAEMTSGILASYDPRHARRIRSEIAQLGGKANIIPVQTKRLSGIFAEHSIDHVHYLSIDVEGAEFSVVKSIDFEKVFIDVIGFESNFTDTCGPIVEYLQARGYRRIPYKCVDIFMIHEASAFAGNILPIKV
jgi:FkbM family methyltransferase